MYGCSANIVLLGNDDYYFTPDIEPSHHAPSTKKIFTNVKEYQHNFYQCNAGECTEPQHFFQKQVDVCISSKTVSTAARRNQINIFLSATAVEVLIKEPPQY